jgi:hypothetical protein
MRGDEARKLCPELQIVQVPTANGKADLTAYRAAGKEVRIRGPLWDVCATLPGALPELAMRSSHRLRHVFCHPRSWTSWQRGALSRSGHPLTSATSM